MSSAQLATSGIGAVNVSRSTTDSDSIFVGHSNVLNCNGIEMNSENQFREYLFENSANIITERAKEFVFDPLKDRLFSNHCMTTRENRARRCHRCSYDRDTLLHRVKRWQLNMARTQEERNEQKRRTPDVLLSPTSLKRRKQLQLTDEKRKRKKAEAEVEKLTSSIEKLKSTAVVAKSPVETRADEIIDELRPTLEKVSLLAHPASQKYSLL